nr:hypothetical protein [Tanacetum cinerariifolium]
MKTFYQLSWRKFAMTDERMSILGWDFGEGREYLKTRTTPSSGRQSRPNFCINTNGCGYDGVKEGKKKIPLRCDIHAEIVVVSLLLLRITNCGYTSELLLFLAYAPSMPPLLSLLLSKACDDSDGDEIRIMVISIVKGYDESERLRKRQDYPQPGVETYCVCSHGGAYAEWRGDCVVTVSKPEQKKEKKNAANKGWTVVTHIKGRKENTEDTERGWLLVQLRTWTNSQKRKIKKLGSISIVLRKGRHSETIRSLVFTCLISARVERLELPLVPVFVHEQDGEDAAQKLKVNNVQTRMFDGPGSYNGRKNGYQEALQSRSTLSWYEDMSIRKDDEHVVYQRPRKEGLLAYSPSEDRDLAYEKDGMQGVYGSNEDHDGGGGGCEENRGGRGGGDLKKWGLAFSIGGILNKQHGLGGFMAAMKIVMAMVADVKKTVDEDVGGIWKKR